MGNPIPYRQGKAVEPVSSDGFFANDEKSSGLVPQSLKQNTDQRVCPAVAYLMNLESKKSRTVMASTLNQIAVITGHDSWENVSWNEIRRNDVQLVMLQLANRDLAPATRNRYLSAMRGVAKEAWLSGAMPSDSYRGIQAVSSVKGSRLASSGKLIKKEDIGRLLCKNGTDSNTIIAIRDRAIIALMLTSGLRKSEVCGLKTNSVSLEDLSLNVIGKGDKEAKVFIQSDAISYLRKWLDIKGFESEFVFNPINKGGRITDKMISSSGITHILERAAKRASVEPFAPHDTRRTFATSLFAAGTDPLKVRDAMRHSSVETTQIYNIQDQEKLRKAIDAVKII